MANRVNVELTLAQLDHAAAFFEKHAARIRAIADSMRDNDHDTLQIHVTNKFYLQHPEIQLFRSAGRQHLN